MKSFLKSLLAAFIGTLAALFICMVITFGIIGSIAMIGSSDSDAVIPPSAILKIDLSQPVTERGNDDPLSGFSSMSFEPKAKSISIYNAVRAIEEATTDPSIKFVFMNLNSMNIGMSQLEELRAAVASFRESGKPVIAYAANYSQGAYYLATVADKIYLQRDGSVQMFGLGTNVMFFKDLLDKLGIEFQLIRHGKFKAAAEQFIANKISNENKEQNQAMLDAIWETWIGAMGKSRDISPDKLNELTNDLKIGKVESLLENNLIDEAVTYSELNDKICTLFGVEREKDLKMVTLLKYANAKIKPDIKVKDKIAILYADGEIAMDGSDGITASKFCPEIKKIREDSTIKALVLRVNSPGGDAQAAEMINAELQLLRETKPVIVSFGDYAASGGYWISAKSDCIYTNNTTITGSIGVFSLMINYGKGLKKHLDINTATITTNRHSDMFSGLRPLNQKEQDYLQGFVEDIYVKFTDLVAAGRDLDVKYVDSVGQGRVWAGSDALELKLADKLGGLNDAVKYAAEYAGLDKYRIAEYPAIKTSMEKFMEMLDETSASASVLTDPYGAFEKIYSNLRNSEQQSITYARLPYVYEFNY